jgi:hypothetical protein
MLLPKMLVAERVIKQYLWSYCEHWLEPTKQYMDHWSACSTQIKIAQAEKHTGIKHKGLKDTSLP